MKADLHVSIYWHPKRHYAVMLGEVEGKAFFKTLEDGPLFDAMKQVVSGIPLDAEEAVGRRYEK